MNFIVSIVFVCSVALNLGKIEEVQSKVASGDFLGALSVNNSITPVNYIEQNFKSVNEMLITILASPEDPVNSEQVSFLAEIAGQCVETGGPAVYQARALWELATGIIAEYNDECGSASKKSNSLDEITEGNSRIIGKIYPNPNNGKMQFGYSIEKGEKAWLVITDLMGRDVNRYQLQEGSNSLSISDAALKNGVYFYKVIINKVSLLTDKLVIIK